MRSSMTFPHLPRGNRRDRGIRETELFSLGLSLHEAPRFSCSHITYTIWTIQPKNLFNIYVISCATFVVLAIACLNNWQLQTIRLQPLDIELSQRSQSITRDTNPPQPLADGRNQSLLESSPKLTANGTRNSSSKSLVEVRLASNSSNQKALTSDAEPRRMVLLVTNQGFLDFTDNLLRSIEKTGCRPNITIVAEDQSSFQNLSSRQNGPRVIKPPGFDGRPKEQNAQNFGEIGYLKLINRRPQYVLDFIEQGFEVFFVDSDTYWFKDPFPYFKGDFDVAYTQDSQWGLNAGVGYYKPTPNTVLFMKYWIKQMQAQAKQKKPPMDQTAMNTIIRSKRIRKLRVRKLSMKSFPNASGFKKTQECDNYTSDSAVFHASYLEGHDNKTAMLEQCNLWIL